MNLYLKPGHKIGKPAPLFEKIEQDRLNELKSKYGGSAADQAQSAKTAGKGPTAEELEKSIATQGDKVRGLKAAKAQKDIVQEQVKILLDLKAQLAALPKTAARTAQAPPAKAGNGPTAEELEKSIAVQGNKVRGLKAAKAQKDIIQEQVKILLGLKAQLAALRPAA